MANRFQAVIGYAVQKETSPGVWVDEITEKKYNCDITKNIKRAQNSEGVNDNVSVSNSFSILADHYSTANFLKMKYLVWMGSKWKIDSVEINYPRLSISLGGIYNG